MKIQKTREIIIELERVQIVRKTAKTHSMFCATCRCEVDFVSLREAASLFATNTARLFQFVKINLSHFETNPGGEIFICLVSFLDLMKAKTNFSQIKMIGD